MASTLARKAAVISAVAQLAEPGDFQSITITRRDSFEDYFVVLVTPHSDTYGMTLKLSSEGQVTYASPLRIL
jgi:hypothetical protein